MSCHREDAAEEAKEEGHRGVEGRYKLVASRHRSRLVTLRRAENLVKERKRISFYRDPFKFVKDLFTKVKSGSLCVKSRPGKTIEVLHRQPMARRDHPPT